MIAQVTLFPDQRIAVASFDSPLGPDAIEVDFPDGFDMMTMYEYRVVDGALVHDPLPPEPSAPAPDALLNARMQEIEGALVELAGIVMEGGL